MTTPPRHRWRHLWSAAVILWRLHWTARFLWWAYKALPMEAATAMVVTDGIVRSLGGLAAMGNSATVQMAADQRHRNRKDRRRPPKPDPRP